CMSLLVCLAPPPTDLHTLSLHDALPIFGVSGKRCGITRYINNLLGCQLMYTSYCCTTRAGTRRIKNYRINLPAIQPTAGDWRIRDRKSTRLNSSHVSISYAVFCLKKKTE